MLKRFFISFLGAVAGIWFSVFLGSLVLLVAIGAIAGSVAMGSGEKKVEKNSILYISLNGNIVDRDAKPDIFNKIYGRDIETSALTDIVNALDAAARDKRIEGVYIDGSDVSVGLANAQAIAKAIKEFRKSGKWVISYADSYSQTGYFISCNADSVLLNPIGSVDIHGLASQTPYFKTLLDRLGVEMQILKVGTYKSAVEPFILTESSEANREQQTLYLQQLWSSVKSSIASARGLKAADIDRYADSLMITIPAEKLTSMKLVDGLRYRHQVEKTLCDLTKADSYDDLKMVTPAEYCSDSDIPANKGKMTVAVLYAVGDISDSGDEGIVGDEYVRQILDIMEDDDIDALIMRVNSPGGSAFASEQIWEALDQFKKVTGKPFYVSMADYAASGGYYISCGADRIYAEPLTLTGSIGVFGMIPNVQKGLREHLGVNFSTVQTNPNAAFPTLFAPMTESQRAAMQRNLVNTYELFTSRVAKGRSMSVDSVKMIAEGRVWDGASALKIGLVDRLGGLDMAIADMATTLSVKPESLKIVEYPEIENDIWKQILSMSGMKIKSWILSDDLDPEAMAVYKAIESIKAMNPVQARMELVEIK